MSRTSFFKLKKKQFETEAAYGLSLGGSSPRCFEFICKPTTPRVSTRRETPTRLEIRNLGARDARTPRYRVKRSAIADRAGWWWGCICRCCGTTAEAEIAGDIGCLIPCPPSMAAAAPRSWPASDVVQILYRRGEEGERVYNTSQSSVLDWAAKWASQKKGSNYKREEQPHGLGGATGCETAGKTGATPDPSAAGFESPPRRSRKGPAVSFLGRRRGRSRARA